jgi:hypothetical protein
MILYTFYYLYLFVGHINKNVGVKLSEHFHKKEERDNVSKKWNDFVCSSTSEIMEKNYYDLINSLPNNHPFAKYVSEIWYPLRGSFVKV